VAGGTGFLGSHIMARLKTLGAVAHSCSRASGCDLRAFEQAAAHFSVIKPDVVINCAANQGGLAYHKAFPATIFYDNLLIGLNAMEAARITGVGKYVNILSACAYPGEPKDGILREAEFEAGPMHSTVDHFGATKRAALMQAKCYASQYAFNAISLLLVNMYGPGEDFHPDRSHALAALVRKFYEAKESGAGAVTLWGTGRAVREWLYVEDAAEGVLRAVERHHGSEPLNLGVGSGCTITELAEVVRRIVGYRGKIVYDDSKPDGAMLRVADIAKMRSTLDWEPQTAIETGIRRTIDWFVEHRQAPILMEV